MGFYVHIQVSFACDENEGVAALAKKHLPTIGNDAPDAVLFLEALASRTGRNAGPKGGLSLWGMIGNYTSGDDFVEALRPFWGDLLSGVAGGPRWFERVVVFVEREQRNSPTAYQIGFDDPDSPNRVIAIQKHELLPFSWGQM